MLPPLPPPPREDNCCKLDELLLGYVLAQLVKGSGGGRNCGVLNRCWNRASNVSPPELDEELLYPELPPPPTPPPFLREPLRSGGVGAYSPVEGVA